MTQNKLTSRIEEIKNNILGIASITRSGSFKENPTNIIDDFYWAIDHLEKALEVIRFYADGADWEDGFQEYGKRAEAFLKELNK